MCWNAEVSLKTFLFGVACALYLGLFTDYNKQYLLIVLSFSSMQLLEYFAWSNINNKKIINILSYIGLFIIFLQVFLINYILTSGTFRIKMLSIMILLIILFLIIEFKNVNFSMKKGQNGHLIWYWLDIPIIWIFITFAFYLIPLYYSIYRISFYYAFISIIISLHFYFKYKTWGTMWCYMSNIIWIYITFKAIFKLLIIN